MNTRLEVYKAICSDGFYLFRPHSLSYLNPVGYGCWLHVKRNSLARFSKEISTSFNWKQDGAYEIEHATREETDWFILCEGEKKLISKSNVMYPIF